MIYGTRSLEGALTGSPIEAEETLAFSLLARVRPRIETMPLEAAAEAYGKMMRGEAAFEWSWSWNRDERFPKHLADTT